MTTPHRPTPGPKRLATRLAAVGAVFGTACAMALPAAAQSVTMSYVGRADSGVGMNSSGGGSEISAYSAATKRLFVTNGATNKIDIFDLANAASPKKVTSVTLPGATGVQSVATNGSLVAAVATVGDGVDDKLEPGRLFVFDTSGKMDSRAATGVEVGALPDSVHFTPDGNTILTANEGEPKNYCKYLNGAVDPANGAFVAANDPKGTVSIVDATAASLRATTIDFAGFDAQAGAIRSAGGRIFGPGASVAQDLEPEYIAVSPDSKKAFVTLQENNAVAEIDLTSKSVVRLMGLGYKDHSVAGNELDSSNEDSLAASNSGQAAINIVTRPVFGMYQPDNIATFTGADGAQYFLTANEGDSRAYPCLLGGNNAALDQEELDDKRLRSGAGLFGVTLGGLLTTDLVFDSQLGRTRPTRFAPADAATMTSYSSAGGTASFVGTATNEKDGGSVGAQFKSLYMIGARSVSIWKVPAGSGIGSAVLVADTGSTIERVAAERIPAYFNSDGDTQVGGFSALDSRSPAKGPEPEGIATGRAFGMQLAFVGLERQNGVMAFDVSSPAKPRFLDYLNTAVYTERSGANYATSTKAGDVSPEGVLFLRATDSPTGKPALIVSNELSGTTAIYNLNGTAVKPDAPTDVKATIAKRSATVTWKASVEDGGAPITSYVATARPGGLNCEGAASCTIAGLRGGKAYTFTVVAKTSAGTSAASGPATASTDVSAPTPPRDIKVRGGGEKIRVSWLRSADGGGAPVTYTARVIPGGASCTATGRSCEITGLDSGTRYAIRVVAANRAGSSATVAGGRIRLGLRSARVDIAPESPVSVRWLVASDSRGRVRATVVDGPCAVREGQLVATGAVGQTCEVRVHVGRTGRFDAMTTTVRVQITAPRDYRDLLRFGRAWR